MTGQGFSLQSSEVNTWEWLVPLLVAAPCIAVVGFVMQQAFLRWNQGQELRQALITIAVSVIVADQIIAHFPRNVGAGHPEVRRERRRPDLAGLDRPLRQPPRRRRAVLARASS